MDTMVTIAIFASLVSGAFAGLYVLQLKRNKVLERRCRDEEIKKEALINMIAPIEAQREVALIIIRSVVKHSNAEFIVDIIPGQRMSVKWNQEKNDIETRYLDINPQDIN